MNTEVYRVLSRIAKKAGVAVPRPETDINSTEWVKALTAIARYMGA